MKKIVSVLLAFGMFLALSLPAFASPEEGGSKRPRYEAINNIIVGIDMEGNTAYCYTDISHTGARATVKIVLQRSSGSGYSDYSTLSNVSYSSPFITVEKTKSGLSLNYDYRTKVVLTVYDSRGRQIDSETAYS